MVETFLTRKIKCVILMILCGIILGAIYNKEHNFSIITWLSEFVYLIGSVFLSSSYIWCVVAPWRA